VIEERPTRPAPSAEVRVAGPGADHVKAEDVVLLERRPRSPLGSSLQKRWFRRSLAADALS
jgi:hypothetical protein